MRLTLSNLTSTPVLGGAAGALAEPLVLLFGWLGSKQRYVHKYEQLWEQLGARQVLTWRPSVAQIAVPQLADAGALRFAELVAETYSRASSAAAQPPPVIVQCMSGAGFIAFGTLLHLVAAHHGSAGAASSSVGLPALSAPAQEGMKAALARTRGVVLDSAPPHFTPGIWSRGLVTAMLSTEAHGVDERYPGTLRLVRGAMERYIRSPTVLRRMVEVRQAWHHAAPLCPQLYLYSKADPLIPHAHVEQFMELQRARGAEVHSHCWSDSGHCDHLRLHPEQYRQLLLSFSEHALFGDAAPAEAWI